jgi:hypothetical protein
MYTAEWPKNQSRRCYITGYFYPAGRKMKGMGKHQGTKMEGDKRTKVTGIKKRQKFIILRVIG